MFLWMKALHVIFVVSWFAGLFYLPRIYVNLAMIGDTPGAQAERERLLLMARKLLRFMTILMVPALGFGLVLWLYYGVGLRGPGNGWMHVKLAFVLVLLCFDHACRRLLRDFELGRNRHSHRWYRWFNEIPTVALFVIVPMVVVKPF